jgi:hypothetical protein
VGPPRRLTWRRRTAARSLISTDGPWRRCASPATYAVAYEAAWKPFGVEVVQSGDSEEKCLGKERPDAGGGYWLSARHRDPDVVRFCGLDPALGPLPPR